MEGERAPVRISRLGLGLLLAAAFVVVVAGLKLAAGLVVPVLLAAFITVIVAPVLLALERRRVPTALGLLILMLGLGAVMFGVAGAVGKSVRSFNRNLPLYQQNLQEKSAALLAWLDERGVRIPEGNLIENVSPGAAMQITGNLVAALSGVLGNTLLILLIVVFMLLEATLLPGKLKAELTPPAWRRVERVAADVRRYMGLKTLISIATGLLVTLFLAVYGVDSAVLLGLIAFALNFVPNVGSFVAAVPGVLLALVQFGLGGALGVAIGYVVINVVMGNVVEPRVLGSGLGLSPLVVLLSLIFWGWVFGAIGMLLAIPLTMVVVIVLEGQPETRRLAHLLGAHPVPE